MSQGRREEYIPRPFSRLIRKGLDIVVWVSEFSQGNAFSERLWGFDTPGGMVQLCDVTREGME